MSSITKVSDLFKINISFPPQLLGDEASCLSVCAGVHVFMCILVYICNNLGKRQIKRAFIYKPCSVCCGSKLQSLSPVSGKSSVVPALEPPLICQGFYSCSGIQRGIITLRCLDPVSQKALIIRTDFEIKLCIQSIAS